MTDELDHLLAPLRARPERSALLFDFDGTLSPVVDDPDHAAPAPGVVDLLAELAGAYGVVGVVSGRPVAFLARHLPPEVALSGLYGMESRIDGEPHEWSEAERWRPVVAAAAAEAEQRAAPGADLHGLRVEEKGLSITLHWRTAPQLGAEAEQLARHLAASSGLHARPAKMSVELHPPVPVDKGTAVRVLAERADQVLFAGDDVGDVPAFDALAELAAAGRAHAVAVAVGGPELPEELRRRAQVVLPEQADVRVLLERLRP